MEVVRLGKKTKQCHGSVLVGRGCRWVQDGYQTKDKERREIDKGIVL